MSEGFCPLRVLSTGRYVYLGFCPLGVFFHLEFCPQGGFPTGFFSTAVFVRFFFFAKGFGHMGFYTHEVLSIGISFVGILPV